MKDQLWMVWTCHTKWTDRARWWPALLFWGTTRQEAIQSWRGKYLTMADWRRQRKAGRVKCVRTTLTAEES